MKWKAKIKPNFGDSKQVKEFLIFPMKYNDYWYWMEWAIVKYYYIGWRWGSKGEVQEILTPTPSNSGETTKN